MLLKGRKVVIRHQLRGGEAGTTLILEGILDTTANVRQVAAITEPAAAWLIVQMTCVWTFLMAMIRGISPEGQYYNCMKGFCKSILRTALGSRAADSVLLISSWSSCSGG
jgi:hypothetical protein